MVTTPVKQSKETRMKQFLANISALAFLLGCAGTSHAQSMDNIYQVEVIIFERLQRTESSDVEYWPKNIELSYPQNRAVLVDPNADTGPSEPDAGDNGSIPLNTFLAPAHRDLSSKRDALDRQHGYRILFHQTWLQRLEPPASAPALVIRGGNAYGDHSELEGYLSLSLSRYLHFQGHLWLTEFVANFGQPLEHWPELPTLTQSADPYVNQQQTNQSTRLPDKPDQTSLELQGYGNAALGGADQPRVNQWSSTKEDPYTEMLEAPYLIKSIAVLQQKRRMRSGEVHYIDHPKMGILLKVEPRTAKQIKELSATLK